MMRSYDYYKTLHDSIVQLESSCKQIDYKVLPSTINRKRTSKFIKSNSNTFKTHNKVGWVQYDSHATHTHSQSVSCDLWYLSEIPHISWQSQDKML